MVSLNGFFIIFRIYKLIKKKIPLIIGRLPEPNNIGGVVVFVSRLLASSKYLNANGYTFYSTKDRNILNLIPYIYRSLFVHYNGSNPLAMFVVALICFLFRKKLILSIHSEVGQYRGFKNLIEKWAIKLAYKPVVGQGSIVRAFKVNTKSVVIPSFIVPTVVEDPIVDKILSTRKGKKTFCTNANKFALQSNGDEIYGICHLVEYFSNKNDSILIVVDTSKEYANFFEGKYTPNVIFLNEDINFSYLIKRCDCFIRFTSTDGDSISVMESLFLKVPVIATDCIKRHGSCILCRYGNFKSLDLAIEKLNNCDFSFEKVETADLYYDELYIDLSTSSENN